MNLLPAPRVPHDLFREVAAVGRRRDVVQQQRRSPLGAQRRRDDEAILALRSQACNVDRRVCCRQLKVLGGVVFAARAVEAAAVVIAVGVDLVGVQRDDVDGVVGDPATRGLTR